MNKLTVGSTDYALPSELFWIDEFDYTPNSTSFEYSLTGAIIVYSCAGLRQSGRPITLTTPDVGGWMTRSSLVALYATLNTTGTFTLELHGSRTFSVIWRHADNPINASPVYPGLADPTDSDWYAVTLRFTQV